MSPALNRNHFHSWYDDTLWAFTLHLQFRCQQRSEMKSGSLVGKTSGFQLLISVYRPEVAINAWFMTMANEMFCTMVFIGRFNMLITLHCNILYIFPSSTSVITCLVPRLQVFYASYLAHFHLKQTSALATKYKYSVLAQGWTYVYLQLHKGSSNERQSSKEHANSHLPQRPSTATKHICKLRQILIQNFKCWFSFP